jgi:PAS domain-containing protein
MDAHGDLVPFADAAVVIAGCDGRVAWASPAVETLLGHQLDAIVGSPIDVLVPDEFKARHRAGWRKTWMRRHLAPPDSPVMIPVVCGDGEVRRFASHILPLAAPHGELLAVAAVWTAPSAADASVRELT